MLASAARAEHLIIVTQIKAMKAGRIDRNFERVQQVNDSGKDVTVVVVDLEQEERLWQMGRGNSSDARSQGASRKGQDLFRKF